MANQRCYRNRCNIYSLYWASQSEVPITPEEICNINYTILELPEWDPDWEPSTGIGWIIIGGTKIGGGMDNIGTVVIGEGIIA